MLGVIYTIIWIALVVELMKEGVMGRHIWELTLADLKNESFLLVLLTETLYGPFIWIIKLSLFLLYLEIFTPYRWLKHAAWGGIIVTGLFYGSSSIIKLALCVPRGDENYIDAFSSRRCNKTKVLAIFGGVFNILSDLYLLVLPIPGTWKLQVPPRKKCAIMAVFMTGIRFVLKEPLVSVLADHLLSALNASILGLHYRHQVQEDGDDTWNTMPLDLALYVVALRPTIHLIINQHDRNDSRARSPCHAGTQSCH